ncbi:MAG: NAD+ synthase [Spirochaetota bacterium]
MKITACQINPTVGDIQGNLAKMTALIEKAHSQGSDLVVFPELSIIGYPVKDLLEWPWFTREVEIATQKIRKVSAGYKNMGVLFGTLIRSKEDTAKNLHNSAVLMYRGDIVGIQSKVLLPTYDVFDETRHFVPPADVWVINFKGKKLGVSICEDAWSDPRFWPKRMYKFDPIKSVADKGADFFVNISASPFTIGKEQTRYQLISTHAKKYGAPFLYVNQVGGNDELVFDGRSMFINQRGQPVVIFPPFREHIEVIDTDSVEKTCTYVPQQKIESVYQALILGIQDYVKKSGFTKAVVGLSGGIDSSVVFCLACAALGSRNVLGLSMPSPFSSTGSLEDSRRLAANCKAEFKVLPVSEIYQSYQKALSQHFEEMKVDKTMENIQARIRGNILMAFANKYGYLVLSTGNKSEMAVGYCTLYGDMSGGLSAISDVPKTMVYDLAGFINRKGSVIPDEIFNKAPSAELSPGQKDRDSLPPYQELDQILYHHIEEGLGPEDITRMGFDYDTVVWVIRAVARSEFKRKQAPPGLKVTTKAFGAGRRFPLAAKYDIFPSN